MWTRALVAIALAGFLGLTARALSHYSYVEFLQATTANAVVSVLFFDLVICLGLIAVSIYRDARGRGISPWPYVAIGASLGVAGPLLYLLRRPRREEPEVEVPSVPSWVLLPILVAFTAATAVALHRYGYAAFLFFAGANEATSFCSSTSRSPYARRRLDGEARSRRAAYLPFSLSRSSSARSDPSRTSSPADFGGRGSVWLEPSPWPRERSR
jgi:hypothetical protein